MPVSFTRVWSLLFVAAVTVSASGGQPPGDKKDEPRINDGRSSYTAFPDLKPSTTEQMTVTKPDGTKATAIVEKDGVQLPPWPTVAADAPPLRKLQFEQLKEGRAYLERVREVMRIGSYNRQFIRDYFDMTTDVYRLAAEMEDKPAHRVRWYEARVCKLKEFEQSTERGVGQGAEPPQVLNMARFRRLQAEIDLTKLKTDIEKTGGK